MLYRAGLVLLLCTFPVRAGDDYLLVFASEVRPYNPLKAHTFAVVVNSDCVPGQPPQIVDFAWISWLPDAGVVRAFTPPEKGRNVPLHETLCDAVKENRRITLWGPYRIKPELAATFRARMVTLENCFQYKGAAFWSPKEVCDCARAVEEMVGTERRWMGIFGYGAAASSAVVRKFAPWLIEPEQSHPWVVTLLDLDKYPLTRRKYGDFTEKLNQFGSMLFRR